MNDKKQKNGPMIVFTKCTCTTFRRPDGNGCWLELYPSDGEYIIDFFMIYGRKDGRDESGRMKKEF
jgi:hypothetical protein